MIHGVINIHKEKGYTSHDVVAKLRGIVGQKKIGHTAPPVTEIVDTYFISRGRMCQGKGTARKSWLPGSKFIFLFRRFPAPE